MLAAIAEQEDELDMGFTLEAMQRPLEALGYEIIGRLPVFGVFERGGVRENREVLLEAQGLGVELGRAVLL